MEGIVRETGTTVRTPYPKILGRLNFYYYYYDYYYDYYYYYYDYDYDYDYYYYIGWVNYYCVYFKLSLCLQVRIVVQLRITIIWAVSYHVSNGLMLHLRL